MLLSGPSPFSQNVVISHPTNFIASRMHGGGRPGIFYHVSDIKLSTRWTEGGVA